MRRPERAKRVRQADGPKAERQERPNERGCDEREPVDRGEAERLARDPHEVERREPYGKRLAALAEHEERRDECGRRRDGEKPRATRSACEQERDSRGRAGAARPGTP